MEAIQKLKLPISCDEHILMICHCIILQFQNSCKICIIIYRFDVIAQRHSIVSFNLLLRLHQRYHHLLGYGFSAAEVGLSSFVEIKLWQCRNWYSLLYMFLWIQFGSKFAIHEILFSKSNNKFYDGKSGFFIRGIVYVISEVLLLVTSTIRKFTMLLEIVGTFSNRVCSYSKSLLPFRCLVGYLEYYLVNCFPNY